MVKKIFKIVDESLGFSLSQIILNGPEKELKLTQNTQPAILTIGVSIFEVLKNHFDLNLNNHQFYQQLLCIYYLDYYLLGILSSIYVLHVSPHNHQLQKLLKSKILMFSGKNGK